MAISDSLNRRLRARRDEDEDEFEDDVSSDLNEETNSEDNEHEDSNSDNDNRDEDDEEEDSDMSDDKNADDREAIQSEFRQISFGALAKAQDSIGKKRKRGDSDSAATRSESSTLNDIREKLRLAREKKRDQQQQSSDTIKNKKSTPSRSSKHAPTVQSSKVAVSRKRIVVEPPSVPKARDPRFDSTIVSSSSRRNKNGSSATEHAYAFLDDYRASELKQLQEQHKRTKDPVLKEKLAREIRSATDRQRAQENKRREQEVMSEHKKKERELIREGKKSQPYYLKKSELKREVLKKKYESMGSRERAKALERRRKKVAAKERRDLPWARRGEQE
ncbi:rRNA biogenesis protein rrp36 [Talaromyces atroroseus]|uniref:rRNA biogenesis protein RRP36 n=1 Tax=Talaromyces atroroseus TaxID=1441469 RepID=A0A225ARA7_TALAT|nr:rRNA biogenesis protein rrp36 [Talaromyces atroroseus]OKL56985.1 rRNA biogenesis protein rrp36 [Talaromyces atroroseus]